MEAKYQKEIKEMFLEIIKEDFVFDDTDHEKALDAIMAKADITYQRMSDAIEEGEANGVDANTQLKLFKMVFKKEIQCN